MTILANRTIAQLAADHPLATRVFSRHRIDFCCGGERPLDAVCAERGLDVEAILAEIRREVAPAGSSEVRWNEAPLADLVQHVVETYHRPLKEELPRLEAMARKVEAVHHDKEPEMLGELLRTYLGLKQELDQHLAKEEQILFPMIARGQGVAAGGPIAVMHHEHDSTAAALARIRELTGDYTVPAEACNTWRALWHGLATLEESLREHIGLENEVLYPRALAGN